MKQTSTITNFKMNFVILSCSHLLFLSSPSGEHADAISRKKSSFFVSTNKKNMEMKRHNLIQATGLFFLFFFTEIDIPVVEAMRGGRWMTARTGKSCVNPVATADLFNPAVHEWSTQIGVHTRGGGGGGNCLDFPTFCVLQSLWIRCGGQSERKSGSDGFALVWRERGSPEWQWRNAEEQKFGLHTTVCSPFFSIIFDKHFSVCI